MKKVFVFFCFINVFSLNAMNIKNDFFLQINTDKKIKLKHTNNLKIKKNDDCKTQIDTFSLKYKDTEIPVTFYNRNSNVLMIAAPALPAAKESMETFAKMFSNYDVIIFDYRWEGQYIKYLIKSILMRKPVQKVLFDPIQELKIVLRYAINKKKYKKIVGLGECYSCFHFLKLQSDSINKTGSGLFTHLILDSPWYSLRCFVERICYDPFLPMSPQDGGAPKIVKWCTNNSISKNIILRLFFLLMKNVSIESYLSNLKTPVLFVHGQKDLFVPNNHFNKIWNASDNQNRAVLSTPYKHSDNLGNKKIYRYIAETFIASDKMQDFAKKVSEACL